MERLSRRGKIPQKDWPSIIARHEAGETLASIARTYDCSPPAISYIVSRSRKRNLAAEPAAEEAPAAEPPKMIRRPPLPVVAAAAQDAPAAERHLLKAGPGQTKEQAAPRSGGSGEETRQPPIDPSGEPPRRLGSSLFDRKEEAVDRNLLSRRDPLPGDGGSLPRAAIPAFSSPNGGQRRVLHLSLGAGGHDDGAAAHHPYLQQPHAVQSGERPALRPAAPVAPAAAAAPVAPARLVTPQPEPPFRGPARAFEPTVPHRAREPYGLREGGGALDPTLRQRVDADIAAFLAAFDGALAHDTAESRALLREATDRLLRAGARTRIELERLEARLPLPPRGKGEETGPAWGQR